MGSAASCKTERDHRTQSNAPAIGESDGERLKPGGRTSLPVRICLQWLRFLMS